MKYPKCLLAMSCLVLASCGGRVVEISPCPTTPPVSGCVTGGEAAADCARLGFVGNTEPDAWCVAADAKASYTTPALAYTWQQCPTLLLLCAEGNGTK